MKCSLLSTLVLLFVSLACSQSKETITIEGNLTNLPDGRMCLYTRSNQTGRIIPIDTVSTHKGVFSFKLSRELYPEPVRAFLEHIQDSSGIKRFYSYKTNLKYRGASLSLDHFLLEDGVKIEGVLSPIRFKDLGFRSKSESKVIFNSLDRPLTVGQQTQVAYNDTMSFSQLSDVNRMRKLVQQYPYAYHFLYGLEQRLSNLSNEQFQAVFSAFDSDVQRSPTGRKLMAYVENRPLKRLTFATRLVDQHGQQKLVLNPAYRYNLVILWASWCGPCRQEIPELKQLYRKVSSSNALFMTSVSLDQQSAAWHQAVRQEQMPWSQLLVSGKSQLYSKELFSFDGAVPTLLLIDQGGKLVRKLVGYSPHQLQEIEALVTRK